MNSELHFKKNCLMMKSCKPNSNRSLKLTSMSWASNKGKILMLPLLYSMRNRSKFWRHLINSCHVCSSSSQCIMSTTSRETLLSTNTRSTGFFIHAKSLNHFMKPSATTRLKFKSFSINCMQNTQKKTIKSESSQFNCR